MIMMTCATAQGMDLTIGKCVRCWQELFTAVGISLGV
jgi:hypothetical protein